MNPEELKGKKSLIRHQFMVFRNGMVADALKKAGYPYSLIFGLQLPQLQQISLSTERDYDLAFELWKETDCRESRLFSFFILPTELEIEKVKSIIRELKTSEEAEIFNFKFLRFYPFASDLLEMGKEESLSETGTYCLNLLRRHLNR